MEDRNIEFGDRVVDALRTLIAETEIKVSKNCIAGHAAATAIAALGVAAMYDDDAPEYDALAWLSYLAAEIETAVELAYSTGRGDQSALEIPEA